MVKVIRFKSNVEYETVQFHLLYYDSKHKKTQELHAESSHFNWQHRIIFALNYHCTTVPAGKQPLSYSPRDIQCLA